MSQLDPTPPPATPPAATRRSRTLQLLLGAAGLLALVLSVFVLGPPAQGLPLDPTSVAPTGLRGMVEMLEALEVEVTVDSEPPGEVDAHAFLPVDRLDDQARTAWMGWIEDGGELVVADPDSALHGLERVASDQLFGRSGRGPACELFDEADGIDEVRQGAWEGYTVPDDDQGCFPVGDEEGAWLVRLGHGAGALLALGSAQPFTNALLDEADNAVLAAALLAPARGDRLVVIPRSTQEPATDRGLLELVPGGVWQLLALLVLASVLAVVWQGRRDGVVVAESLPPVLPSAELARSLAGLLQRAGDRNDAAARLRRANYRAAVPALGLPPDLDRAVLVAEVTRRTAVAADDAEVALLPGDVADDAGLVAVAAASRRLRAGVTHAPADPGDPG